MADSVAIVGKKNCCGCRACGDICPTKAITFTKDDEGFVYPSVQDACVKCGLCTKICPALHNQGNQPIVEQSYKACFDKSIIRRDTGSSGGIFGLLANKLVSDGWYVCGAAFDDNLKLKHILASSEEEIGPLKKSKYLQSDTKGIYSEIKAKLDAGGRVMFVGTPCQCKALQNFLNNSYTKQLLVVDFACHGVPSQDLFDKCIDYYERKHHCKVISYQFRYKPKKYGSPQNYKLEIRRGSDTIKVEGKYYQEPFYYGFQKYMTLRPSCYQCPWANTNRISDISLADFWGIETITEQWDRRDHPSLVILNTDFGKSCFQRITTELAIINTTRDEAIRRNRSLVEPTKCPSERELFFKDLQVKPFDFVVKRHLKANRRFLRDVYYSIPFEIRKKVLNKLGEL